MVPLAGLEAPIALVGICALLFIEEAGVPLPMFPGDALLLTAGVLMATGAVSPWLLVPLAYLSVVAGASVGYAWSRRVGSSGLARLADRLRVRRHLDRATARLRRSGAMGVMVGRLLPGTRVYTTLVAGSVRMPLRSYAVGLLVSSAAWMALLTGLGAAAGIPVVAYLHQVERDAALVALQVGLALTALVSLRVVRPPAGPRWPSPVRLVLALSVDLVVVALMRDVAEHVIPWPVLGAALDHQVIGVALTLCLGTAIYLIGSRLSFGATAGEGLSRISYGRIARLA